MPNLRQIDDPLQFILDRTDLIADRLVAAGMCNVGLFGASVIGLYHSIVFALIPLLLMFALWGLSACYVRMQKEYQKMYECLGAPNCEFDPDPSRFEGEVGSYWRIALLDDPEEAIPTLTALAMVIAAVLIGT